jgi:hypothetical protein
MSSVPNANGAQMQIPSLRGNPSSVGERSDGVRVEKNSPEIARRIAVGVRFMLSRSRRSLRRPFRRRRDRGDHE